MQWYIKGGKVMKVIRYVRKKDGSYAIFFDDDRVVCLYEEVILENELLLKSSLSSEFLNKCLEKNKKWQCYHEALSLLKKKMKTTYELTCLLKNKGYDEELCSFAVSKLLHQGYLDDLQYAKSYVHFQMLTTSHGPFSIQTNLQQKRIDSFLIEQALQLYDLEKQQEKVEKIVKRKSLSNQSKSKRYLVQKLQYELLKDGFDKNVVNKALKNLEIQNESAVAKREYEKLYRKFSKKYDGKELEYRLQQKMYQLGFTNDKY